jgi:hypothetical protein
VTRPVSARVILDLGPAIERERMVARETFDPPPILPAGARVVTMDADGNVAPAWQWAEAVVWAGVVAYRCEEGEERLSACILCGQWAVDVDKDEADVGICDDCLADGDYGPC